LTTDETTAALARERSSVKDDTPTKPEHER
jgi:hypothetical protein